MKVLTINCTYDQYSTGTIIMNIANQLKDIDFFFCYEYGPKSGENRYRVTNPYIQKLYYLWARLTGLKHSTGIIPTLLLLRKIKRVNPDIVHIHCPYVNTIHIPLLISKLKANNAKIVITNHAEFFYTGNCQCAFDCMKFQTGCGNCKYVFDPNRKYLLDRTAYEWQLMKKAFNGSSNIVMVAVSPWALNRICISPISSSLEKRIIFNGIDTEIFNDKSADKIEYDNFILQVTGRFSDDPNDLKGGFYTIKLAEQLPDHLFLVAGTNDIKNRDGIPSNLIVLGPVTDQRLLAEYYRKAKLMVVTSKRETFGMTCAESLCCGTPVVGFVSGGTESIAIPEFTEFCEHGDVETLKHMVLKWEGKKTELKNISPKAIEKYSRKTMAENYNELYAKMVEEL